MIQSPLITIFVPVFNGEKYVDETLLSIKKQTYTHIEVLLVDDSSTDGSRAILDNYANEDKRFKVFSKQNGGMVACSWNFIMPYVKGEYFFYASQDDIFSIDLIEKMVQKQQQSRADTVLPDMELYFENHQKNKQIIGLNGDRSIELTGKDACKLSINWTIHGFALFKTSLMNNEFVPEDTYDSDGFFTRKLFLKSNKVVFSEGTFFYRQDNPNAITKTFSKKNFYVLNTNLRLFNLLKENQFEKKEVFDSQLFLLRHYSHIVATFGLYNFDSKEEKDEVQLFLMHFKKKYLIDSFYFHNISYSVLRFKWRYLLLILVFKISFLFRILLRYKKKRIKNTHFY